MTGSNPEKAASFSPLTERGPTVNARIRMDEVTHSQASQNTRKTVLEIDLVAYSDVALMLEENLNVEAVKIFEDKIQEFVDRGLDAVHLRREDIVLGTSGDNAILCFDDAETMHHFAQVVQNETLDYNSTRSVESAKRWFRMGAATGIVLAVPSERRIVGSTIARAVRLEAAAEKGQLVIDRPTFEALPDDVKRCYGGEEVIEGKREEHFVGHRCTLIDIPQSGEVTKPPLLAASALSPTDSGVIRQPGKVGVDIPDKPDKSLRTRWIVAAVFGIVTVIAGALAIFIAPALFNPYPSKALPEVAGRQPALTLAPALGPAAPPGQPAARETFDPEKVPFTKNTDNARKYLVAAKSKALAVSASGNGVFEWYFGIASAAEAQRRALEACEFRARSLCFLYATDDEVEPAPGGHRAARPALAPDSGTFDHTFVPFVSDNVRRSLVGYASAHDSKAIAVSPSGVGYSVTNAATAAEAQRLALERCSDAVRNSQSLSKYPCYLYATGDSVVLYKRVTGQTPQ